MLRNPHVLVVGVGRARNLLTTTEDRTGTFRVAELYPLLQDFNLQVNPNAGFIRLLDVKLPFFVYLGQSSGILCLTQVFLFV